MKNIIKKLIVLVLTLVMVLSMTSCGVRVLEDEKTSLDPENPYYGLCSGYNVVPASGSNHVWKATSLQEVDRAFDYAMANLYEKVSIDFADVMGEYDDLEYFLRYVYLPYAKRELQHITSYTVESRKNVVTFHLEYNSLVASHHTPKTKANTYESYTNINMLVRDNLDGGVTRSIGFDDFAINKDNVGEMKVYNSEGLWWALEHNYLPVFPVKNTKAEAFYNEAKKILRQIINDDMTDYDKVLAIYEYLIDTVEYDYDALKNQDPNDVCFFLEGVFEYNRAVCDGYSKAFVLLCRIEGIECLRDYGSDYSTGGTTYHAWNYVKIDGTWYAVDATAGDPVYEDIKAEVADYSRFLCDVNTYVVRYQCSGIWDSVLADNDNSASLVKSYFDNLEVRDGVDFYAESSEEMVRLIFYVANFIKDNPGKYTMECCIIGLSNTSYQNALKTQMSGYSNIKYTFEEVRSSTYMFTFIVSGGK